MANIHDISRNAFMLRGPLAKKGYDWWWHSLTAENAETGEKKPFYVEFFACNPARAADEPVIVWNDPEKQKKGTLPSYVMVNVGFWGEDHGRERKLFRARHQVASARRRPSDDRGQERAYGDQARYSR